MYKQVIIMEVVLLPPITNVTARRIKLVPHILIITVIIPKQTVILSNTNKTNVINNTTVRKVMPMVLVTVKRMIQVTAAVMKIIAKIYC